ncbi:hypothetical protein EZV62_021996 [Acer yangbiense]|uniref:RRM domain-containing protein n=1 Tax=Acer yangbiense TaxID=1000413 RepID=A0A5C7H7B5_9ROSI|nr:hypothetical protein EZV62_021996 [Acer yangbiense]
MSHFGKSGPPDIRDTYSLLVLNITFRTGADDLFPLFDKYGKVVDVFIPRNRRTGESRGFAFVRYKYADEAQKAVEKFDGRVVDGREIMVQFAKYGPNANFCCLIFSVIRGKYRKLLEKLLQRQEASQEATALVQGDDSFVEYAYEFRFNMCILKINRYQDEYRDKDSRKRSRSRSRDRHDRDKYCGKERDHCHRSMSRSASPDRHKYRGRDI